MGVRRGHIDVAGGAHHARPRVHVDRGVSAQRDVAHGGHPEAVDGDRVRVVRTVDGDRAAGTDAVGRGVGHGEGRGSVDDDVARARGHDLRDVRPAIAHEHVGPGGQCHVPVLSRDPSARREGDLQIRAGRQGDRVVTQGRHVGIHSHIIRGNSRDVPARGHGRVDVDDVIGSERDGAGDVDRAGEGDVGGTRRAGPVVHGQAGEVGDVIQRDVARTCVQREIEAAGQRVGPGVGEQDVAESPARVDRDIGAENNIGRVAEVDMLSVSRREVAQQRGRTGGVDGESRSRPVAHLPDRSQRDVAGSRIHGEILGPGDVTTRQHDVTGAVCRADGDRLCCQIHVRGEREVDQVVGRQAVVQRGRGGGLHRQGVHVHQIQGHIASARLDGQVVVTGRPVGPGVSEVNLRPGVTGPDGQIIREHDVLGFIEVGQNAHHDRPPERRVPGGVDHQPAQFLDVPDVAPQGHVAGAGLNGEVPLEGGVALDARCIEVNGSARGLRVHGHVADVQRHGRRVDVDPAAHEEGGTVELDRPRGHSQRRGIIASAGDRPAHGVELDVPEERRDSKAERTGHVLVELDVALDAQYGHAPVHHDIVVDGDVVVSRQVTRQADGVDGARQHDVAFRRGNVGGDVQGRLGVQVDGVDPRQGGIDGDEAFVQACGVDVEPATRVGRSCQDPDAAVSPVVLICQQVYVVADQVGLHVDLGVDSVNSVDRRDADVAGRAFDVLTDNGEVQHTDLDVLGRD